MEMESEKKEDSSHAVHLKRLEFVRMLEIRAVVIVANLYDFAMRNCGPLKSTVVRFEGTVKTVLGPVHDKLKGVPLDLLVFLDDKVDEAVKKFNAHAPLVAKNLAYHTGELIGKTSEKAQILVKESQTRGPHAAMHYALTESKPVILSLSVNAWAKMNEVPSLHMVVDVATLTAAHWTKKYNDIVVHIREKGYPLFSLLPLVPVDEIAEVFKVNKKKKIEMEALKSESY